MSSKPISAEVVATTERSIRETAMTFMHLIREDEMKAARRRERVIPLARLYGLSIEEIASESGLAVERVELILEGAGR